MLFSQDITFWLICGVFTSQLLIISVFVSANWRKSRTQLLQNYPESTFPNLYANPSSLEFERLTKRKWLDIGALMLGLIVLAASIIFQVDNQQFASNLIYVAIIQIVPPIVSAYWCIQNSKIMSKKFPPKIRKAELSANGPIALLPKIKMIHALLLSVMALSAGSLISTELTSQVEVAKTTQLQILNGIVCAVIFAFIIKVLLGAKSDHFAEPQEANIKKRAKLGYLLNALIAFNLFIIAIYLAKYLSLSNVVIMLAASLFVQIIVFTTKDQYLPVNPAAYKAKP